jgi:hypothetical protein
MARCWHSLRASANDGIVCVGRREAMKARGMIEASAYGPDVLRVLGQAFDEAWAEIAHRFGSENAQQSARLRLAHCVLAVAKDDEASVEEIKRAALLIMEDHRDQPA